MLMKEIMRQNKSLFISAGHSMTDPGAMANGFEEADFVLEFRDLVADALRHSVVFTKDGDRGHNLPLNEAVAIARVRDIAVEFHCNASIDARATGVETLSNPEHFDLGRALCETVSKTLKIHNRGPKAEDGGYHSRLAFVGDGDGILLELFFLSNRDDLRAFHAHKYELARNVADVLIEAVTHGQA